MEEKIDFLQVSLGGRFGDKVAFFDLDFADHLEKWTWRIRFFGKLPYVTRGSSFFRDGKARPTVELAHRFICGCKYGDGLIVDHINGNTLDNRRKNLRLVTRQQNVWNRAIGKSKSGYLGVQEVAPGCFAAKVRQGGKYHYCGSFASAELAAIAVNKKLLELRPEYARLNIVNLAE